MHDINDIVRSSIWRPASVTQEPETVLTSWRVMEVELETGSEEYTTHFVGWASYEGRVCSPVKNYDPSTRRGVTSSGRVYELRGGAGMNSDAMYVWSRWLSINGNPNYRDVSEVYDVGI